MIRFLLFALFFFLLLSDVLRLNLGLAPGVSLKNAFLYLIFLGLAVEAVLTRRHKLELLPVIVPFFLYALYAIFSWLVVVLIIDYPVYDLAGSMAALKGEAIEPMLIFLVFFYGITNQRQALWFLRSMLGVIVAANIVSVIDSLDIPDLGLTELRNGRAKGFTGNPIVYAAFLVFYLPPIAALFRTSTGIMKWFAGIGFVVSSVALLMTVSRGAFVGLISAGFLGSFYLRASIPGRVFIRASLGVLVVFLIAVFGSIAAGYGDLLLDRLIGLSSSSDVSSGRTDIWGRALGRMLDYPITFVTGFGWYAYKAIQNYLVWSTHNHYLSILYDLGVIGVVIFLLLAVNMLRAARATLNGASSEAKPFIIAFIFGFTGLLVTMFFTNFYDWPYIYAYTGILFRLAVSQTGHEPVIAVVNGQTKWDRSG